MTYLNVEGCTNLGTIWCYDCALEGELDLSELPVSQLRCYNNPELTVKLPVIASDRLGIAYLYAEGIKAVGPLNATTLGASLRTFNCPNLTRTDEWTLDLSGEFTIYVTRIDVSGNPTLKEIKWNSTSQGQTFASIETLNISGTQIGVQPLIDTLTERSGNPEEFYANAMVNGITTLDVSKFTNLRTLELSGDAMTSITLPATMAEYSDASVTLANNKFTTLPAIPTNAKYVILAGNELTTLPTIPATVTRLDVSGNNFETLDVSGLTALQYLYVNDNNLTTLDVTQNTDLAYLRVENNENMTELSLAGLEKLSHLDISVTKIPLSVAPTTLFELHADRMAYNLTAADFSTIQQLHTLHISNNPSLTIRATAGSNLRWSTSGTLPSGVTGAAASDNLNFTISGTPATSTAGQNFTYEITATNTAGEAKATITLSVARLATVDEINNMTPEQKAAENNLQITSDTNIEDLATLLEGFTNLEALDLTQATINTVTLPTRNNLETLNLSGNTTVKTVDVGSTGGKLTTNQLKF